MSVHKLARDKKRWYFQFYFNGRKIKKESWNGQPMLSKNEALQCEAECRKQIEIEEQRKKGYITLEHLYSEYVETAKSNLKETSLRVYDIFERNYLIHLPYNKIIYDITPSDIMRFKNYVASCSVSIAFKNRLLKIVKSVLEYGSLMYNLLGKLQFPLLEPFKDNKVQELNTKSKHLPIEEFKRMLTYLDISNDSDYYYYVIFNVLYFSGLRIGELAALTIDDFKNGWLIINKDYARVNGKDIIQAPKNANSIRKVLLDDSTKLLLEEYISKVQPKEIIFSRQRKYLTQQRVREILRRIAQASELDLHYEITPHTLRHSHASNLRNLGFDAFTIAKRLGNTPDVSASTYIHSSYDEQHEIIEKMSGLVQK